MPSRYWNLVVRVPYWIGGASVIAIVLIIAAGIATRNLGIEATGLQTLAQLVGVWLGFLAVGAVAYEHRHIEIDNFTRGFTGRLEAVHDVAVLASCLAFALTIIYGGIQAMDRFWDSVAPSPLVLGGFETSIPIPLYYLAPILGFALVSLVYVVDLASLTPLRSYLPEARGDEYIDRLKRDSGSSDAAKETMDGTGRGSGENGGQTDERTDDGHDESSQGGQQ